MQRINFFLIINFIIDGTNGNKSDSEDIIPDSEDEQDHQKRNSKQIIMPASPSNHIENLSSGKMTDNTVGILNYYQQIYFQFPSTISCTIYNL